MIDEIAEAIETARRNKADAETKLAGINSAIKELKESLDKAKAEESELHSEFESRLRAKEFADQEVFLAYMASEEEIAEEEKEITAYHAKVKSIGDQLRQAEADARGKAFIGKCLQKRQRSFFFTKTPFILMLFFYKTVLLVPKLCGLLTGRCFQLI